MHWTRISIQFSILIWVIWTIPAALPGQALPDSVKSADTSNQVVTIQKSKPFLGFLKKDYPNPRTSALLSIVPGAGQIYNKKYWWIKVPVIYGGLAGLGLVADFNTKEYKSFKEAYIAELNGQPHKYSELPVKPSANTLKNLRDIYDKRRQITYIGISVLYLANIFEAYVAAHLLEFDVSEDLSLKVQPFYQNHVSAQTELGIGVRFDFK